MIIGEEDTDFGLRSKEQAERYKKTRARPSETETPTSCSKAQKLEDESDEGPDLNTEADGDGDYQPASERREPRSDMMAVLVPKDPLSSPGLVAMLDRQKVSTYGATGLTAAYIKGFKSLDGKDLNLNDFVLSQASAHRKINKTRNINAEAAMDSFKNNLPEHITVHWDGKQIKDYNGKLYEAEVVVVTGRPNYAEGKLLGKDNFLENQN